AAPHRRDRRRQPGAARRRGARPRGRPRRLRGGSWHESERAGVSVPSEYFVALSAVLFGLGAVGVVTRRSAILVFLSIEMMLNAANLAIVAFARQWTVTGGVHALEGQGAVFIVLAVAAAEVAVGLGILVAIFRHRVTTDVDQLAEVRA